MKQSVTYDSKGLAHLNNQAIVELALQGRMDHALFEWQDMDCKAQFQQVCLLLDHCPIQPPDHDENSRTWFTPAQYQEIDLDQYVLARCKNLQQKQRAQQELAIINRLGVAHIFRHLIFLVDCWRSNNLVWGVGRGSSVSCFVLYAIGLNKINPLDYDLDMSEFFKTAGELDSK